MGAFEAGLWFAISTIMVFLLLFSINLSEVNPTLAVLGTVLASVGFCVAFKNFLMNIWGSIGNELEEGDEGAK